MNVSLSVCVCVSVCVCYEGADAPYCTKSEMLIMIAKRVQVLVLADSETGPDPGMAGLGQNQTSKWVTIHRKLGEALKRGQICLLPRVMALSSHNNNNNNKKQ